MNDGVHTLTADLQDIDSEIVNQYAHLGLLLARPAISREAEIRRAWSIAAARRSIARLERLRLEVAQDLKREEAAT